MKTVHFSASVKGAYVEEFGNYKLVHTGIYKKLFGKLIPSLKLLGTLWIIGSQKGGLRWVK